MTSSSKWGDSLPEFVHTLTGKQNCACDELQAEHKFHKTFKLSSSFLFSSLFFPWLPTCIWILRFHTGTVCASVILFRDPWILYLLHPDHSRTNKTSLNATRQFLWWDSDYHIVRPEYIQILLQKIHAFAHGAGKKSNIQGEEITSNWDMQSCWSEC